MRHEKNRSENVEIPIAGSSVFGRYPKISSEKTYNMFLSDGWLVNFAGYRRFLQLLENGEGRGAFVSTRGGFILAVINSAVYRIANNFGFVLIGNLETSGGEVFIDENLQSQICIVDGLHAYIYNHSLPPNLTPQSDGHLGVDLIPNYVTFHNTYFLFGNKITNNNGSKWFAYKANAATTIQYFATMAIESKPDFAKAVVRIPGQSNNVLVLGGVSSEIHTNVAGFDPTAITQLPYRRNSSISIDYGVLSIDTIAFSDEYVAWLGVNESNAPAVMVYSGSAVERISTDGIDYLLGSLKNPNKSTATFFRQDGHVFYVLTFYGEEDANLLGTGEQNHNVTIMYDFTTKMFFNLSDENLNYHPMRKVVYFENDNFFISLRNGSLYRLSTDLTTINENLPDQADEEDPRFIFDMQRIRICATFRSPKSTPFTVNSFTFTIEQGNDDFLGRDECTILMITEDDDRIYTEDASGYVQVIPEDGDPEDCIRELHRGRIDLSFSKNGGMTYSNTVGVRMRPLGWRQNILRWQRMGYCNEFTPKVRFWSMGRIVASSGVLEILT
jgi:hypothetical protein